jgi:hypothetical protein
MGARRSTGRMLVVTAGVTFAAVATASPSGAAPRHTSCKDLGALVASEAHAGTIGAENRSLPHGTVDDLLHTVQVGGTWGDEVVPPFCTPK